MTTAQGLISKGAKLEVSFTSAGSFSAVASTKKIARTTGSFVADGFAIGNTVYSDITANPGPLVVTNVSALELTFGAGTLVDASAAAKTLTSFVKVGEIISMQTPAGAPSEIDMTNLDSDVKEFRNGLRDEGSITGEANFVPDDQGQKILRQMSGETAPRTCAITIPQVDTYDGYRWQFSALGRGFPAAIPTDGRVTANYTLRVTSLPTETLLAAP